MARTENVALPDLFDAAYARVQQAAKRIGTPEDVLAQLHYPKETLAANLLLRRDDGSLSAFKAGAVATATRWGRPRAACASMPTAISAR